MFRFIPILVLLGVLSMPASSEILLLQAIEQQPSNSPQGLQRPRRGEHMASVESRFGQPVAVNGPVGEPPISRWDYPEYSVFFEYDTVIDCVVPPDP